MSTRFQVEVLLHIAALGLVEWALFQVLRSSVRGADGLSGLLDSRRISVVVIMIAVAILWGGPLMYAYSQTRLSLRSYFVFLTLVACLIAAATYLAS